VPEPLSRQAEAAVRSVVEGIFPLCRVGLKIHEAGAYCPCCGDSYRTEQGRLEIGKCTDHGRDCEHWEAVWLARAACLS
jgi:hypothetical protein